MAKKKARKSTSATGRLCIVKDPRVYAARLPRLVSPHKRAAGIDLGTCCGIAFCDFVPGQPVKSAPIIMGQWDLSLGPYDAGPLRHIRLKQFLSVLQPDLVLFEEVKYDPPVELMRSGGTTHQVIARAASAAEFLGGLKVVLTLWCEENGIPAQGISISQIKKWATGKGNANKVDMINAANEQFGTSFDPETYEKTGADNICDAAFVCAMGIEAYSEGL